MSASSSWRPFRRILRANGPPAIPEPPDFTPDLERLFSALKSPSVEASYAERRASLAAIGFASYQAFLASDLWADTKARVYRQKGRECLVCGDRAVVVHHSRYAVEDLRGRCLDFLFPLCHGCHEGIEYAGSNKLALHDVRERLQRILEEKRPTEVKIEPGSEKPVQRFSRHKAWLDVRYPPPLPP
jgi:hypothetical protein